MVGRVRVELTTSRLSGVRSNHLSYRPKLDRMPVGRGKAAPRRARSAAPAELVSVQNSFAVSSR